MKRTLLFLCLVACCVIRLTAQVYQSLDLSQPIKWENGKPTDIDLIFEF